MPELPDVQNFCTNLKKIIEGKKIKNIKIGKAKNITDPKKALSESLEGAIIKDVYRSGKELRILFSNKKIIGIHLMLTGDIYYFNDIKKENKYKSTIVELLFSEGDGIALLDRMRNAYIRLDPVDKKGIDALDARLNYHYLKKILNRRAKIKNVLIDQDLIRGIGNSYSDEILWAVRLSPFSISNAIPDNKIKELASAIKKILRKASKEIGKKHPGIIHGEIKDYLTIHTKLKDKSPTGAPIRTASRGMLNTYYTDEQVLYE